MFVKAIVKHVTTFFLLLFCLNLTLAQSGMIDIDYQVVNPSACNQLDGAIHITPLTGIAPFEYSINGGASFQADSSFTNLGIGTYILLVRDAEQKFSSFILAKLQADGSPSIRGVIMTNPTQCEEGGTLKILTEGGFGMLQYSIDSGRTFQTDYIFSDVPSGLYYIMVSNEGGSCLSAYPPVSFAPQSPMDFISVETVLNHPDCDSTNGAITINVMGGSGDYLYSINNGETYQSSNVFNDLGDGTYAVLIRDTISNCEKGPNQIATLMEGDCMNCEAITITYTTTNPACDTATGVINMAITGGSGNYLYSLNQDTNFQESPDFSDLSAGDYILKVRDIDYDCEKETTEIINLIAEVCPNCDSITLQSFLTFPTCNTLDGQIELTLNGGSGDYSVSINGEDFQTTLLLDNLGAGSYTVTVRDNERGCEKVFTTITLNETDCPCNLNLFTQKNYTAMASNCASIAPVCLDIPLVDLMKLEILDNGVDYAGGLAGCAIDTMLTYLYFTLPGQGLAGPYRLDRWELNDSIYRGEFEDIHALVAMMNRLDPEANWERDAASMTLKGGFPGNTYGALEITQLATDMIGVLQLNTDFLPQNSQLSLAIGSHQLIFRDPINNCQDTISVNVDCPPCPLISVVGNGFIKAEACNETAKVCFAGADSLDLSGFTIRDNGVIYNGSIENCSDLSLGFELALDTGRHQVVFDNGSVDCQFVFDVVITCEIDTIIQIDTIIYVGETDTICFPAFLMNDNITSIEPTCEGQNPSVGFEVNNLNNCLVYEGLIVGVDTLCLSVCENNNACEEVIITVTVLDTMIMDTMIMDTMIMDTMIMDTMIMDTMIMDTMIMDTMIMDTMIMDTMIMDTMIMDTTCQSIFIEKTANISVMDCSENGQYCLGLLKSELANYRLSINDSLFTGEYLDCEVPEQASLELPVGNYQLILSENEGVCRDTAMLNITCQEEIPIFEDTIMVNEMDTFCLDSLDLPYTIASIHNICEGRSGERVIFMIDSLNNCLIYTGIEEGIDTACVVTCDSLNNCDTIIVVITVEEMPDTILPPIAIDDRDTVEEGKTKTINVLGNDTTNSTLITVVILEQPSNGTAMVNPDLTVNYMANDGLCDTTDTFIYELCNPAGCDTATVIFYIECKTFLIFNGFSPNGDNVNETFTIDGIEDFPNNKVQIFNRWGNMVFEQTGYKGQWNGTWNNKDLPDGTYFYLLNDGEGKQYSGFLEIRR